MTGVGPGKSDDVTLVRVGRLIDGLRLGLLRGLRPGRRCDRHRGDSDHEAAHGMGTEGHSKFPLLEFFDERQNMPLDGREKGGARFVSGLLRNCNRFGERQDTPVR